MTKKKYGDKMGNRIVESLKWNATVIKKEHPPSCSIMKASYVGMNEKDIMKDVICDCSGHNETFSNLVVNGGMNSIVDRLIDTENTNSNDGFINYLEIGMSDTTPLATQTSLIKPKSRKFITYAYRDTTNAVFKTFFNGTQANSNSTIISIGTLTSQFSVVSGTGALFTIGELIEVGLGSPEVTEITNISGDIITVNPPLASIPSGGETVKQAYGELGLFGTSSASSSVGTGVMFARTVSFTPRTKDSGYGMTIEWHIALT